MEFPLPPTRSSETAIDVKEFTASVFFFFLHPRLLSLGDWPHVGRYIFTASVTRVFQETLPLLSEKGRVNVQCGLLPIL